MAHILDADEVTFLVNTGDDFEHLGLHISPDLDTLAYTLAGISNKTVGWGRENETWNFEASLQALGGETWFRLGDKDLALHIHRTHLLRGGSSLTSVTRSISKALGIHHTILPMSDDPVRTVVTTDEGTLPFQEYFVHRQCEPRVLSLDYRGADSARLNPSLALDDVSCVIICPSNPYLSIGPMLAVEDLRDFLSRSDIPVVAISPIVKGVALKGPTAKMMGELGLETSAATIADSYKDICSGFVLDCQDTELVGVVSEFGLRTVAFQTIMRTLQDRIDLARNVLKFCNSF